MLPPALGDFVPTGAAFEDGALHVTFDAPGAWLMPRYDDPLDDLRERISATQEAAQRLAGEQHAARSGRAVRPQGWARRGPRRRDEAQALVALLQALRELVPRRAAAAGPRAHPPGPAARCARSSTGGSTASKARARSGPAAAPVEDIPIG